MALMSARPRMRLDFNRWTVAARLAATAFLATLLPLLAVGLTWAGGQGGPSAATATAAATLAALAALVAARVVTRDLSALERAAARLVEGDLDVDLHVTGRAAAGPPTLATLAVQYRDVVLSLNAALADQKASRDELRRAYAELEAHNDELERLTQEMALLSGLAEVLHVCGDREEARRAIRSYAERLFPEASGSLFLIDGAGRNAEPLLAWGRDAAREMASLPRPEDCWSLRRGCAHAVRPSTAGLVCGHVGTTVPAGGTLCVPMMAHGHAIGFLHLRSHQLPGARGGLHSRSRRQLAMTVAEHVALALANIALRAELAQQALHDPLTGLHNRRHLEECLQHDVERVRRSGASLALALLDLDHFKSVNDRHGHEAGDAVLRQVAEALQASVRRGDLACRFGGEEFALVFPNLDLEIARDRLEELLDRIRALAPRLPGGTRIPVTASAGLAALPAHGSGIEDLFRAADEALYRAKAAGRDRVVTADEPAAVCERG
jgi:diguanylate cyclase (GGDEF)-like protein